VQAEEAEHERAGSFTAAHDEERPAQQVRSSTRACAQPHLHAREQQPDHERLVVDAPMRWNARWVADVEPERLDQRRSAGPAAAASRRSCEARQREQPVREDAQHHAVAGEGGDSAADDEEERTGRRGVSRQMVGMERTSGSSMPVQGPHEKSMPRASLRSAR
jgi:hypothetical protein